MNFKNYKNKIDEFMVKAKDAAAKPIAEKTLSFIKKFG